MFITRLIAAACISTGTCVLNADASPGLSCLAPVDSTQTGALRYAPRRDRCEGALPRYVGRGEGISLIGYGAGGIDAAMQSAALTVPHGARHPALTLRALSLTSGKRYQMDMPLSDHERYGWPLELVRRARSDQQLDLDPATIGVLACTNRCASRPDTVYFPVYVHHAGQAPRPLAVSLRAEDVAVGLRVRLLPFGAGRPIESVHGARELYPDDLTRIPLPQVAPGQYRLEVRATSLDTRQPMPSLLVRIYVP